MDTKKLMVAVLVLGGIICILASLCICTYLYHLHAVQLAMPAAEYNVHHSSLWFALFVALPSALTLVAGIVLTTIGIKIGLREE